MKIDQKLLDLSKLSAVIEEMKGKFQKLLDILDVGLKVETEISPINSLIITVSPDCEGADNIFESEICSFPFRQGWDFL